VTYEEKIVQTLNRYKRMQGDDPLLLITVTDGEKRRIGVLRPITADFRTAIPECAMLLSRWRLQNPTLSPTRFTITAERTEKWLDSLVIGNPDRVLFLVQDSDGNCIGHMGFAGFDFDQKSAAVDLVVRGEQGGAPGLMGYALHALIRWGKAELGLRRIGLEVLWDNDHAIAFYMRCGFLRQGLIPLERQEVQGETRWGVGCAEKAEKYYLHMDFPDERMRL